MNLRILLVCRQGVALRKYLDASKGLGAQIDIASSLKEFYESIINTPYNGLMIDMPTKLKILSDDKVRVHNILEQYPVLQLVYNENSGHIRAFYAGQVNTSGTLEEFLTRRCHSFSARTVRAGRRKDTIFNVVLFKCGDVSSEENEKTIIMNVSRGGCFIYSNDKWEVNSEAWFIIQELTDQTPVMGQVQWNIEWGKYMCVPGIGLRFKDIKDCQLKELYDKSNI